MPAAWRKWVIGEFSPRRLLLSLAEIYLLVMIGGYLVSDRLIFCPQESYYLVDGAVYSRIPVNDRESIVLFEAPGPPGAPAVLFIHGNAEDVGDLRPLLEDYAARGFRVFSFDYRGYGLSDGRPGFRRAQEDTEAVYRHLVEAKGVEPRRLIVHGRSVGAAFAVPLAADHPVGGLIVQSGFVSAFRTLTRLPLFPLDKGRNLRTIRRVRCPILIVHGLRDAIIPPWHGRALYDAAPSPKEFLWTAGAGHDDVPDEGGEAYWTRLVSFASLVDRFWSVPGESGKSP